MAEKTYHRGDGGNKRTDIEWDMHVTAESFIMRQRIAYWLAIAMGLAFLVTDILSWILSWHGWKPWVFAALAIYYAYRYHYLLICEGIAHNMSILKRIAIKLDLLDKEEE